ncbi:MAG: VacJ family lipoprotein [Burkholderiaceae bacterium]|jgi:phospholipid-binding lipoprotein MlaA|nr:VacJ family lipoprotein [Burkholderiaceae bacterium]
MFFKPDIPTRRAPRMLWLSVFLCSALAGCASAPVGDARSDPLESYNRSMYAVNDAVDRAVLKPAATAYKTVLPGPVRQGVNNFFGNLGDVWSFANNTLQFKPEGALTSFWRVVINSTMGLGGVLDPATELRLEKRTEDFGQTLGHWGVKPGPYVVLPLLGSSTLRDTLALPVDFYGNSLVQPDYGSTRARNGLAIVRVVDTRAGLLGVSDVLEAAALDRYSFQRDAYLQKRRNDVYDGNPPPAPESGFEGNDSWWDENSATPQPAADGAAQN